MIKQKKAVLMVLWLGFTVLAGRTEAQTSSAQPRDLVFAWTAPTVGTSVVKYQVEIRRGGHRSSDVTSREVVVPEVTIAVDWLTLYEVRVRGVDAANRVGPWSAWSLAEDRDRGAPGF